MLRQWLRGAGAGGWQAAAVALVDGSARVLEARFSRRTALTRIAVAGSALAVAPVRYLLYPGTALGVVVPGGCNDGLCTDGYTAFCCEIHHGLNTCPEGTFVGGWWMCTDYRGHQLCQGAGVRYYVDCNNLPGRPFPGGCRCADNDCSHRRQACNVFRYGQCNTHIKGTTTVVCRVVTCEKPSEIPSAELQRHPDDRRPRVRPRGRMPGAGGRPVARERGSVGAMVVVTIVVAVLLGVALVYIVALLRSHADILRRLAALEERAGGRARLPSPSRPRSAAAR